MGAHTHVPQRVGALCWIRPGPPSTDLRTTAKQCYHCQGYGHVQADCPTLRISGAGSGGRCYTCGQPGHLAVSLTIADSSYWVI